MLKRTVLSVPILALAAGFAQTAEAPKSAEPVKFYKLEFVVREVEGGKVLNSRSYSLTAAADGRQPASMRTGSKVPVAMGAPGATPTAQFQYVDVGVNIDCRSIQAVQHDLSLVVIAEVSSLPSGPAASTAAPVVRQNRWSAPVIVPLKRPTLIFSSDDPASTRQMQLELTATPIM